jgi:hypothetical protein
MYNLYNHNVPTTEYLDGPLLDLFADLPPFSIQTCTQYAVGSRDAMAVQNYWRSPRGAPVVLSSANDLTDTTLHPRPQYLSSWIWFMRH